MIGRHPSGIVRTGCVLVSPFVMMFGFYVIAHGHYVPGGGFAGGVALAVALILPRLVLAPREVERRGAASFGLILGAVGLLVYVATGAVPMLAGSQFLDHAALPIGDRDPAELRYLGILVVEVAVGLSVSGALLVIFDVLVGRRDPIGRSNPGQPGQEGRHG
jgi:multicomponent Na+:H+ antiporter subunit B